MAAQAATPPLGARLSVDIGERAGPRGVRAWARVRWVDPGTGHRVSRKKYHPTRPPAEQWVGRWSGRRTPDRHRTDSGGVRRVHRQPLGSGHRPDVDLRSLLGRPQAARAPRARTPSCVAMISAGLVDRAIDEWEQLHSRSTVKNSVAALVLVMDEAVRDGLLVRNPARDRARRRTVGRSPESPEHASPRDLALPDVATLERLVTRVTEAGGHPAYGDVVTILATTALRISEVSGLRVGDVDLERGLVHVQRQTYPGRGGVVAKATKGRRRRVVPIIEPLRPTLARLVVGRAQEEQLILGPRGGVITTATLRDATNWDDIVAEMGLEGLVRHGLRHTALTWMADAGVELHMLQRVAGHQDPAVTSRYLHPDTRAVLDAGAAFSYWWSQTGPTKPALGIITGGTSGA